MISRNLQVSLNTEGILNKFEEIAETLAKYLEIRAELLKLKMKEYFTDIVTSMVLFFILLFFMLLFFLTGSIVAAIVINNLIGSLYLGYLIIMGVHLILFIIIYINRRGIIKATIYNFVFEEHLEKKDEEKDE